MGKTPGSQAARILWLLIVVALVYTFHRAYVLRIEYFDGYVYLGNARALLRDGVPGRYGHLRPPLLPLAELPGMLVVGASAPGSALRLVVPHFIAALSSVIAAIVVFMLFRRVFTPDAALLGTLLFVGSRFFVRYGAHVLADIISAGCAAATIGAYLGARERPRVAAYVRGGVAFASALLAKFPLGGLAPVLLVAEGWYALRARRFEMRRWAGLVTLLVAGVVLAALVQAVLFVRIYGWDQGMQLFMTPFSATGLRRGIAISGAMRGESWRDWGSMALIMLGPLVPVAAAGVGVALVRREDRDVIFLAWLAVLGGAIVFAIGHNEARYLLPVVPAIIYFAVRALEAAPALLGRSRSARVAQGALVLAMLGPGIRQAWLDRDPVFLADTERRAALRMLACRRGEGELLWSGLVPTLHPQEAVLMPADESFNMFHFTPQFLQYLVDEPVRFLGSVPLEPADAALHAGLEDGDAVLRAPGSVYHTANLPPGGAPAMEVWCIRRLTLVRDGDRFVPSDPSMGIELLPLAGDELAIRARADLGRWSVQASRAGEEAPRRLADVTLTAGASVSLGPGSADSANTRLVLGTVVREVVR